MLVITSFNCRFLPYLIDSAVVIALADESIAFIIGKNGMPNKDAIEAETDADVIEIKIDVGKIVFIIFLFRFIILILRSYSCSFRFENILRFFRHLFKIKWSTNSFEEKCIIILTA